MLGTGEVNVQLFLFLRTCCCFHSWEHAVVFIPENMLLFSFLRTCCCFYSWEHAVVFIPEDMLLFLFLRTCCCSYSWEHAVVLIPENMLLFSFLRKAYLSKHHSFFFLCVCVCLRVCTRSSFGEYVRHVLYRLLIFTVHRFMYTVNISEANIWHNTAKY